MTKPELTKQERELAAAQERCEWWAEKSETFKFPENAGYAVVRSNHWFDVAEELEKLLP